MPGSPKKPNVGVVHGAWGEDVATEHLRIRGYEIVERNARPCRRDARLEIDVVAYDKTHDIMVFVEVKQHRGHTPYERRLRSVSKKKKALLRTACRAWLWNNRWQGAYRFDVIEVFGEPEKPGQLEIDHIERVELFARPPRFVNWKD